MPQIAPGGATFVAPLGSLTYIDHISLVNASESINPLLMKRIICCIHDILHIISVYIRHLICNRQLIHTMNAPSTATAAG